MFILRTGLLAAALAVGALSAQAATPTWRYFNAPDNVTLFSVANNGDGVLNIGSVGANQIFNQSGNWFSSAGGSATLLGGISTENVKISADARYIGANINAGGGVTQAAVLDRSTGVWTAQGGINGGASNIVGMSANGQWVAGQAISNTATNTRHAVVMHDGQVWDLTPTFTGNNAATAAVAVSNDGRVVTGYAGGNSTSGSYWLWNDATQSYTRFTPTVTKVSGTGTTNIQADALSSNGLWLAGGSSTTNVKSAGSFGNNIFAATVTNVTTGVTSNIPWSHDPFADGNALDDVLLNYRPTVTGVSNNGMVIGQFNILAGLRANAGLLDQETFIYFATTGQTLTFDDYLSQLGAPLASGQHVNVLMSISEDGSQISGTMFDQSLGENGETVGFVLSGATLITAVPEPGQWALLGLGLPLLAARRLRRKES